MLTPQQVVGINLTKLRKACGLSQEEFAERCALHRTYISGIERGKRNVSVQNLFIIAKALGCSPCDLITVSSS